MINITESQEIANIVGKNKRGSMKWHISKIVQRNSDSYIFVEYGGYSGFVKVASEKRNYLKGVVYNYVMQHPENILAIYGKDDKIIYTNDSDADIPSIKKLPRSVYIFYGCDVDLYVVSPRNNSFIYDKRTVYRNAI